MKNFVIINGTNSNTITGLAINELPPITKPQLRVLTEEIDGRDGDITTPLGYSAYDKTFTIGLFGNGYDINDIVSFFNDSGTIVFSNEPDKYYKFKTIAQIDYESLLKFKTASITIHCQPFKYPTEEEEIEIAYQHITGDGENITINNTAKDMPLKIDLKGNTSQTGTPTPDSPQPIHSVSGDNTITIANSDNSQSQTLPINLPVENFFNSNGEVLSTWGTEIADILTLFNSLQAGTYTFTLKAKVLTITNPQTTYRWGMYLANSNTNVECRDFALTQTLSVGSIITNVVEINITSAMVGNFTHAYTYTIASSSNVAVGTIELYETQLEKGSKANHYTEYGTTPIELNKIGTYQDYFYKDSGKWYLHKEIGKYTITGNETNNISWDTEMSTAGVHLTLDNAIKTIANAPFYCNRFKVVQSSSQDNNYVRLNRTTAAQYLGFWFGNINIIGVSNLNTFKTYASSNEISLYYPLNTPTNTEITDTTLISQLEDIRQAYSYDTQTNISQTNNDKPFLISYDAITKGTNEAEIENIGNIYSKPTLDIKGTGIVHIYKDNVEILQVDLTDNNNIVIENMNAYDPSTNQLMNRKVIGNYNNITLPSGTTTLRVSGDLTKMTISNYTRYL